VFHSGNLLAGHRLTGCGALKVLVTGGAGFIGTNLCRHLFTVGGYDITVVDDLSAGQAGHYLPAGINVVVDDYTNGETLAGCLSGVDAVVHLAALAGVRESVEDPWPSFRVNVEGSIQLLELARRAKVRKVVNVSTAGALFGEVKPATVEAMVPSPSSPYGASKLAVEGYCSAFAAAYDLPCVTLRFANVYGPYSQHKNSVVAAFIKNILRNKPLTVFGDGTQQRDYLYVGDLVRGVEAVLRRPLTGVYQLGTGKSTTLQTLIATLKKVSGRDMEVCHCNPCRGEVHSTRCNIARAVQEFGYAAPTGLEAGLVATWTWYLENWEFCSRQAAASGSD
jgi:UDP-glucose 4-epimerase